MSRKKPTFREGDRVTVQAIVGPNGDLSFHEPLSTAKMVRPRVEVGDHLYEVSGLDEDSVTPGGRVIALLEDRAWIENNGRDELVDIGKNSRVLKPSSPA